MRYPRVSPHFLACRVAVRPFLRPGAVTVGLSGGADSLALLAAAVAEGQVVRAVVVDHQLQSGSAQVAEQARAQAEQLGAGAQVRKCPAQAGMLQNGLDPRMPGGRNAAGFKPEIGGGGKNDCGQQRAEKGVPI